jgi:RES domain-containing protein
MTAVAEYEQELGIRPGTFCAYNVAVAGVVDLTSPETRDAASITAAELARPWKEIAFVRRERPPTWDLAARLLEAGCVGARVPSIQRSGGVNLVLWRWNDAPSRIVTVLDPQGDLPHHGGS